MAEIWTKLMLRCHATISISNHTYLDGTKMGASWLAPDSTETRERDDEIRAIKKQSATSKEGEGGDTETEAGERQDRLGAF